MVSRPVAPTAMRPPVHPAHRAAAATGVEREMVAARAVDMVDMAAATEATAVVMVDTAVAMEATVAAMADRAEVMEVADTVVAVVPAVVAPVAVVPVAVALAAVVPVARTNSHANG